MTNFYSSPVSHFLQLKKVKSISLFLLFACCMFHVNAQELVFTNHVLESGTEGADNAVYRFTNVTNGVDALVKISKRSSSNIVINNIDVTEFGWPKAFQPQIGPAGGNVSGITNWWVEFDLSFVTAGSNTPVDVSSFDVTALDIDGDGVSIREFVEMYGANYNTVETNSLLKITYLGGTLLGDIIDIVGDLIDRRFKGPLTNFLNIDTAGTAVMATSHYETKNNLKFRIGAEKTGLGSSNAAYRFNSLWFKSFGYQAPMLLPVKLSAFSAKLHDQKVQLQWVTDMEANLSHFVIQRSRNGVDFNDAALVFTEGNSNTRKKYSYSDIVGAKTPIVYYRLEMVDLDGKVKYSEVRIIRSEMAHAEVPVIVYPNPTYSQLRVTIPGSWQGETIVYQVFNSNGQLVQQHKSSNASQTEIFDVSRLNAGVYTIFTKNGGLSAAQRFIKSAR